MPARSIRTLLAAGFLGVAASASAEPAFFAARDADTTVYLFGTIHYAQCDTQTAPLPATKRAATAAAGCIDWMSDTVEAALATADELWIETAEITDESLLLGLIGELGYLPDGQRLTDLMPETELRTLAAMAGPMMEAVLPQLDTMQPWMVSTVLGVATIMNGGASAEEGVDLTLTRFAEARDIPVRGFETAEFQVRLLATDPLDLQVADLRSMAVLLEHGIDISAMSQWSFRKLWEFWLEGDLDAVAAVTLGTDEDFFARYEDELATMFDLDKGQIAAIERETEALYRGLGDPAERALAAYDRIFAARNRNWIAGINDLLARPGTFFVAVGAGHLSGDAAVQVLLEREGVAVERLQ